MLRCSVRYERVKRNGYREPEIGQLVGVDGQGGGGKRGGQTELD